MSDLGAFDEKKEEKLGPFVLGKVLGNGVSGIVRLATHASTGLRVAVKIIKKSSLRDDESLRVKISREIAVMRLITHENVLKLYDMVETKNRIYLILEFAEGGELFDLIQTSAPFSRDKGLSLFAQVVKGIEFCHAYSICHRDLKPENILLDGQLRPKIADFGVCHSIKPEQLLSTMCGSPHYACPEIIMRKRYDGKKADAWSIGVILFVIMTGSLPFDDDNQAMLLHKVKVGNFEIPETVPQDIADLIRQLLVVDPDKRLSVSEIKNHACFRSQIGLKAGVEKDTKEVQGQVAKDTKDSKEAKQTKDSQSQDKKDGLPNEYFDEKYLVSLQAIETSSTELQGNCDEDILKDLVTLGLGSQTNIRDLILDKANKTVRRYYNILARHKRSNSLLLLSTRSELTISTNNISQAFSATSSPTAAKTSSAGPSVAQTTSPSDADSNSPSLSSCGPTITTSPVSAPKPVAFQELPSSAVSQRMGIVPINRPSPRSRSVEDLSETTTPSATVQPNIKSVFDYFTFDVYIPSSCKSEASSPDIGSSLKPLAVSEEPKKQSQGQAEQKSKTRVVLPNSDPKLYKLGTQLDCSDAKAQVLKTMKELNIDCLEIGTNSYRSTYCNEDFLEVCFFVSLRRDKSTGVTTVELMKQYGNPDLYKKMCEKIDNLTPL